MSRFQRKKLCLGGQIDAKFACLVACFDSGLDAQEAAIGDLPARLHMVHRLAGSAFDSAVESLLIA